MHSKKFTAVKTYYNTFMDGERMWDETKVKNAVAKGWITEEEYKEITGKIMNNELGNLFDHKTWQREVAL